MVQDALKKYAVVLQAVLFQAAWFGVIVLHQQPFALLGLTLVFFGCNLLLVPYKTFALREWALLAIPGLAGEFLLAKGGVVSYPSAQGFPFHMLAIWLMFPWTLLLSLRWLFRSRALAVALGAVGGVGSYLAAQKLGILAVSDPLVLALVWSVLMLIYHSMIRREGLVPALAFGALLVTLIGPTAHAKFDVATGGFQFFVFPVYDSRVRTDNREWIEIELTYRLNLTSDELLSSTRTEWERLAVPESQISEWLQQLAAVFPDVKKGQKIAARYHVRDGVVFFLDRREVGRIAGEAFATNFFSIWLSPSSRDHRLHREFGRFEWKAELGLAAAKMME